MRKTGTLLYADLPSEFKAMVDSIFEIDMSEFVPDGWIVTGVEVNKEHSVIWVFDDGEEEKTHVDR